MYSFLLNEPLTACEGIAHLKPSFTGIVSRSKLLWQASGIQQLWSPGTHGCRHFETVKNRLSFGVTQRGFLGSALCGKSGLVNCSRLVRLPLLHPSSMSQVPLASPFCNLEITEGYDEQGERLPLSLNAVHGCEASIGDPGSVHLKGEHRQKKPQKRQFCKICDKAASLCICHHVKTVVENKTSIIILQHPEEKRHHLGSARIALLGLQNVEIISIPEVDEPVSYRIREQVPGSKRFLAGRGGKNAQNLKEELKKKKLLHKIQPAVMSPPEQQLRSQHSPNLANGESSPLESRSTSRSGDDHQLVQWSSVPPWINLQPDVGLLFPSEKALDLWPAGLELKETSESVLYFKSKVGGGERLPSNSPSQLIVLDGTWSKAKRIYFENPWLHSLPHYRLPTLQDSRYGRLRREPRPGFVSTLESIVLALQLLEPETQDLESLLSVFDSMIEDQLRFVAKKQVARAGIADGTNETKDTMPWARQMFS